MASLYEYENAKKIIKDYLKDHNDQADCECKKSWLKEFTELNAYPYGANIRYDECMKCGKKHNFKTFK